MLYWRGIRTNYLSLKLCVVFFRVALSDNIVLVQSLFLSRGQLKKIQPSSLAQLNGIVTTTWFSLGSETLLILPSPICWAVLMMQNPHGICWPRDTSLSRIHEILINDWVELTQARTRVIYQWQLEHTQRMPRKMLLFEMNFVSMTSWCHFTMPMSPFDVSFLIVILIPFFILL